MTNDYVWASDVRGPEESMQVGDDLSRRPGHRYRRAAAEM
jgi:hypothetical protein